MGWVACVLWVVVLLRVSRGRPQDGGSCGRSSLTEGAGWLAATVTVLWLSDEVGQFLGVYNLRDVLLRYTIGITWLKVRSFVDVMLGGAHARRYLVQSRGFSLGATLAMMLDATVLWVVYVPHDHKLTMLNSLVGIGPTLLIIGQYVWLFAISMDGLLAGVAASRTRVLDLGTRVSAGFIALTALVGAVAALEMAGARLIAPGSTNVPRMDVWCPVAGAFLAVALLGAPFIARVQEQRAARQEIRRLRAEWSALTSLHPEVVLPIPRFQQLLDAPVVAERMRIELLDARAQIRQREGSR